MQGGTPDYSPDKGPATAATVAVQVEEAKETLQENIEKVREHHVGFEGANDFAPIGPGTPVQVRGTPWWGRFKTQLVIAAVTAFLILIAIFAIFYRQSVKQRKRFGVTGG